MDNTAFLEAFCAAMDHAFGRRLVFLGIQGSRARGEAGPDSDIDMVVILDHLAPEDLEKYRRAVETLPEREKLCGFVSGARELAAWDRGDLFQLAVDTLPLRGELLDITGPLGRRDARRAVHTGACAIFHACCHNLLHARSAALLRDLYKTARFVLRAKAAADGGPDAAGIQALREWAAGADRDILERWEALRGGLALSGDQCAAWGGALLTWCQELITTYGDPAQGWKGESDDTQSQ